MVSAMPEGSLAPRAKARAALQQIKTNLLQVINSDKIPRDLAEDSLNAIQDAETALTTDGAQTIAYSLETVRQEMAAIQARLAGQPAPQAIETAANGQPFRRTKPRSSRPTPRTPALKSRSAKQAATSARPEPGKGKVAKAQGQQMRAAQANSRSPAVRARPRNGASNRPSPRRIPALRTSLPLPLRTSLPLPNRIADLKTESGRRTVFASITPETMSPRFKA